MDWMGTLVDTISVKGKVKAPDALVRAELNYSAGRG
jgi:hypothetical protein